jgi:heterodisulfide reductase subunit C
MAMVDTSFIESVDQHFDAAACMNCGVCTALCPMETTPLPRVIFRQVMLGLKAEVLNNTEAVYSCLLCKMCEANCPAGVPIAENMRLIRKYINTAVYGLGR